MTALAAKDASLTSTPNSQGPPLTPDNSVVRELSKNLHPNTNFQPPPNTSTPHTVAFRVENSTVAGSEAQHHHEGRRPMDLAALRKEITQTFSTFSMFLASLVPPMKTDSAQSTSTARFAPTDADAARSNSSGQQPAADSNKDPLKHST